MDFTTQSRAVLVRWQRNKSHYGRFAFRVPKIGGSSIPDLARAARLGSIFVGAGLNGARVPIPNTKLLGSSSIANPYAAFAALLKPAITFANEPLGTIATITTEAIFITTRAAITLNGLTPISRSLAACMLKYAQRTGSAKGVAAKTQVPGIVARSPLRCCIVSKTTTMTKPATKLTHDDAAKC